MREQKQYSGKPCAPKQPKVSQGYFAGNGSKKYSHRKIVASATQAKRRR
jgi:hypothetical protein